jgi:hypothetical protein
MSLSCPIVRSPLLDAHNARPEVGERPREEREIDRCQVETRVLTNLKLLGKGWQRTCARLEDGVGHAACSNSKPYRKSNRQDD